MKLDIIFENDHFIAINKPSGLLSIPDREGKEVSLKTLLQQKYGNIFTVHRLDKDTSGIIVFAKDEITHKQLSQMFEGRDVEKFYLGLVHGSLLNESGNIDAPIMEHFAKNGTMITHAKGKPSLTDYKVLEDFKLFSWVQFQIHTGRTHQIRVHMKHIGHSIVCDDVYGDGQPVYISSLKRNYHLAKKEENERPILQRLALHSHKIIFQLNDKKFELEALPPKDLRALLQQLRKWKG
jgi:23S rRNA pseudouridine955/2504/2580 synthase/23S rRNA pseudouridine1911/1915/1917 synthase